MNQVQFLREQLIPLPVSSSEAEVNRLVAVYLAAKEGIVELVDVQADAKHRLRRVIDETGLTDWDVPSGIVICPADATIVTYDASALDKLAAASAVFRRKVYPFRRETFKAGGIRITSK